MRDCYIELLPLSGFLGRSICMYITWRMCSVALYKNCWVYLCVEIEVHTWHVSRKYGMFCIRILQVSFCCECVHNLELDSYMYSGTSKSISIGREWSHILRGFFSCILYARYLLGSCCPSEVTWCVLSWVILMKGSNGF